MSTDTTFEVNPTRSVYDASRTAMGALILRDLVVLWKTKREFVLRTLIRPFLLCFVFLFVFPKIGQAVGGGTATGAADFATVLVLSLIHISPTLARWPVAAAVLRRGRRASRMPCRRCRGGPTSRERATRPTFDSARQ